MPIYEYQCQCCYHVVEVLQYSSDTGIPLCENCGKEMRKKMSIFSTTGLDHNVGSYTYRQSAGDE